ncbi:unnamed protein product [Plutella xylostella]|uniref:(diamondback moth) hypothetical protein n=1 Tax=Plutella xylostella TaxID=51655 RepID=A0A8S4FZC4_PLUXY|nr:unnamed protein product [Plutella xylostella]
MFLRVSSHETAPALSHQSAYSAEQLLACLLNLAPRIANRKESILSSALVLQALVAYQPSGLRIRGSTASALAEVLAQWFSLLMGSLNHSALVGDASDVTAMFYAVTCQLGMDVLRLIKHMRSDAPTADFVQSILVDEAETTALRESSSEMIQCIHKVIVELVDFTKENQSQMPSEEYGVFLKFLLGFLSAEESKHFPDFCDMLFGNGYLKMLPQVQIIRKDVAIRKVSTLVLGEILKVLAQKHLDIESDTDLDEERRVKDIHMGLMELQYGIERPQTLGLQLQQGRPYSLLIYIYFYCQSSDNPEEATAPLLPYLIEHILKLPRNFKPPKYIIKALWLVFAMATISNTSLESFKERILLEQATERFTGLLLPTPSVYYTHNPALLLWTFTSSRIVATVRVEVERILLEQATERFTGLLLPTPSVYYTHNPALLLWTFTSSRIVATVRVEVERILLEQATERFTGLLLPAPSVYYTHNPALLLWTFTSSRIVATVRVDVLSQWLQSEDSLPTELASEPVVWDLLLNVLVQSKSKEVQSNAVKCLHMCIEEGDEEVREQFAGSLWLMLPGVLSEALIDYECQTETNTCHLLELATTLVPTKVDEMLCVKIAVLLSTIFSKQRDTSEDRAYYEYVSLKLALYLLGFSSNHNSNRVLTAYVQRAGFLPRVLTASTSADHRVACAALTLLSYVVHFFTKCHFQPTSILEVSTVSVVKSLRHDSSSERGAALLQLVYTVLNTHARAPLVMSYHVGDVGTGHAYVALRALMFRVQMLCSTSQPHRVGNAATRRRHRGHLLSLFIDTTTWLPHRNDNDNTTTSTFCRCHNATAKSRCHTIHT